MAAPYIPTDLPISLTSPAYMGQEIVDFTTQLVQIGWMSSPTKSYSAAVAYQVSLYQKEKNLPLQDGTLDGFTWVAAWS